MIRELSAERGVRPWAWLMALVVHLVFVVVLVFGVAWHQKVTPPMQAELWDNIPAPATVTRPVPPTPLPPPPPPPAPVKAPEPPPPAPAPPKPAPVKTPAAADINLKKKAEEKKAAEKKEAERKLAKKRERELAEEIRQQRAAALKEEEQDQARREAEEARRRQAALVAKAAQKAKAALIDRYKLAIINKIKANTDVPEGVPDGLTLEVDITVLPTGEILTPVKVVKSSGNAPYDQAVLRGIMRSQPLPLPSEPELRRDFRTTHLQLKHEK
ncbi:MAG: TonB C-terminal domain-containing protein [Betaproteobacteria bacterium]|nr:TonB C-terminal domain-containing protein [Betaproteobacteria bacterium]